MFRRRRRDETPTSQADDRHDEVDGAVDDADEESGAYPKSARPAGPYDSAEVDLDEVRGDHIDLGGLLVKRTPTMQLQLQVDKRSGNASAVLLSFGDSAVELMAVAAPRSTGWWGNNLEQIAVDARKRGGTADEARGPFGTELRIVVPVTTPDGTKALQPSRVSGIDGPRWMLRARFLGKAVTDAAALQRLVDVVQGAVVVRGSSPMAPGDIIALRAPEGSRPDGESTGGETPGAQASDSPPQTS